MSCPVLAGLAGDHLVDVLHIRVYVELVGSEGAEQQLLALLRLQGGGHGQDRGIINLGNTEGNSVSENCIKLHV